MKQPGGYVWPFVFLALTAVILLAAGQSWLVVRPAAAHGGGTPQLVNEPIGPYWISLWTSPEPPRAAEPLHFTIALAEPGAGREAGAPVLGATIVLSLSRAQDERAPLRVAATNANSANRLFYEADVTLPEPGAWSASIDVDGSEGSGAVSLVLDVAEAGGPNWLLWGGGGIAVIAVLFLIAGRRGG
jgi:hypothetical protein